MTVGEIEVAIMIESAYAVNSPMQRDRQRGFDGQKVRFWCLRDEIRMRLIAGWGNFRASFREKTIRASETGNDRETLDNLLSVKILSN